MLLLDDQSGFQPDITGKLGRGEPDHRQKLAIIDLSFRTLLAELGTPAVVDEVGSGRSRTPFLVVLGVAFGAEMSREPMLARLDTVLRGVLRMALGADILGEIAVLGAEEKLLLKLRVAKRAEFLGNAVLLAEEPEIVFLGLCRDDSKLRKQVGLQGCDPDQRDGTDAKGNEGPDENPLHGLDSCCLKRATDHTSVSTRRTFANPPA